ncbi:hypothetical protein [Cohnella nanjingensis]|uniref:hypothetical protein n=1 Tax=Cohnella nanjingensis TaxID=1387779 RepID=UPI001C874F39|nr:hypothetical protein [Cohnella nanjingensis]
MDEPWRYRNKAQVPIGTGEGGLVGGFYEQGSHDIVDMEACLIQQQENEDTVRDVKAIARSLGYSAYDRSTGRGARLLAQVVASCFFSRVSEIALDRGCDSAERAWISNFKAVCY